MKTKIEEDHSKMVTELVKEPEAILYEMTEDKANLLHAVLGIAGEAGELVDAIKKYAIYNKPLDVENVVEELGDLEFYMEQLRQELNLPRLQTLDHNIQKLAKRYGGEYSDQKAQNRADKDTVSVSVS